MRIRPDVHVWARTQSVHYPRAYRSLPLLLLLLLLPRRRRRPTLFIFISFSTPSRGIQQSRIYNIFPVRQTRVLLKRPVYHVCTRARIRNTNEYRQLRGEKKIPYKYVRRSTIRAFLSCDSVVRWSGLAFSNHRKIIVFCAKHNSTRNYAVARDHGDP